MNELCEKFGDALVILAFPTNQFGHQENGDGREILDTIKHVRPGNGFEPKCILLDKVVTVLEQVELHAIASGETTSCTICLFPRNIRSLSRLVECIGGCATERF